MSKFTFWYYSNVAHILQFDTMIFPEVKDKSNIFKRFINYAFGATSNPPEFSVPPIDEMRQQCMTHYLDPFKYQLLTGQFKENFELFEVVDNFAELYQCCLCQYYGCSESQNQIYPWKEPKINVVSCCWLFYYAFLTIVVVIPPLRGL